MAVIAGTVSFSKLTKCINASFMLANMNLSFALFLEAGQLNQSCKYVLLLWWFLDML